MRKTFLAIVIIVGFFVQSKASIVIVDFYGHLISINTDEITQQIFLDIEGDYSCEKKVDYIYYELEDSSDTLLKNLEVLKLEYQLDDFGFLLLIDNFIDTFLGTTSTNSKVLLKWYILVKCEYEVELFYNDEKTFFLYGLSLEKLVRRNYRKIKGSKYYAIGGSNKGKTSKKNKLWLYEHNQDIKGKIFRIENIPRIDKNKAYREIRFDYLDSTYIISYEVNLSVFEYLNDLPDIWFGNIHIRYNLSNVLSQSIFPQINSLLIGKPLEEKIRILLWLVQNGIEHKADASFVRGEDWYFPEETLSVGYGDCEDKANLFAYLIDHLLGINTVLFNYVLEDGSGHVNIGIDIPVKAGYETYNYNGKSYVICETAGGIGILGKNHEKYKEMIPEIYPLYSPEKCN